MTPYLTISILVQMVYFESEVYLPSMQKSVLRPATNQRRGTNTIGSELDKFYRDSNDKNHILSLLACRTATQAGTAVT